MGQHASTVRQVRDLSVATASADEEAAADLVSNDDWRDLQAQTRTGKPLGAVVLARRTLEAKSRVHLPSCPTLHRARRLEASASFAAVEMNHCWAHRTLCLIGVSFRTRTHDHHHLLKSTSQHHRQSPRLNPSVKNCPNACAHSLNLLKPVTRLRQQNGRLAWVSTSRP